MKYPNIKQLEDVKENVDFNAYVLFNTSKVIFLFSLKLTNDEITSALYTDFIRRSSKDKKTIKKMNCIMKTILKKIITKVQNESKN
jgi:hypothetical protein